MLSKGESSMWYQAGDSVNGATLKRKLCCDTVPSTIRFYPYWAALLARHTLCSLPGHQLRGKQLMPSKKSLDRVWKLVHSRGSFCRQYSQIASLVSRIPQSSFTPLSFAAPAMSRGSHHIPSETCY